jgi:hypothetical protein
VVAMAISLREDEDTSRYEELLLKYVRREGDALVVDLSFVTANMTLFSALMDATAEHLEMTVEELGDFLLMEKFKRDLFDG